MGYNNVEIENISNEVSPIRISPIIIRDKDTSSKESIEENCLSINKEERFDLNIHNDNLSIKKSNDAKIGNMSSKFSPITIEGKDTSTEESISQNSLSNRDRRIKLNFIRRKDKNNNLLKIRSYDRDENITKVDCNTLAEYMLEKFHFIFYNNALYFYDPPIYRILNEHEGLTLIKDTLSSELNKILSINHLKEVLNQIKITRRIQKDQDEIKNNERFICFKNGIYDIFNRKIIQHSHSYYFFSYVNANYNHNHVNSYEGKNFEKYLQKITDGDNELKQLICEVMGYIISNSMASKKLFILVGSPDSGKTTFGRLLEDLIGFQNCCAIPLQDLNKRFMVAELSGKKLCVNMDLPDTPISDTGLIKSLTGNDLICAEKKNKDPFYFRNEAKLFYGTNKLPRVSIKEDTEAFYKRLIIIPFRKSISVHEIDKKLNMKLIEESNYIIHKCILALENLIRNNFEFTYSYNAENIKQDYVNDNNSVIEFINKICNLNSESRIYTDELHKHYIDFCKTMGHEEFEIFNLKKFSNIVSSNFEVKKSKWRDGEENKNGFIGITII